VNDQISSLQEGEGSEQITGSSTLDKGIKLPIRQEPQTRLNA